MVWGGLIWKTYDPNVHLAWARQAQDGHLFVRDLFTTEGLVSGEKPLFLNLLPALWGLLAHTGIPIIFWFHLTRVAAGVLALWEFHRLAKVVLPGARDRVIALWLVALTTGSSFLAVIVPALNQKFTLIDHPEPTGNFPTMPEAFLFTSAFSYPLNIVAYWLLAFLIRKVLTSREGLSRKDVACAFIGAVLLSNIHTYDAIPLGATLVLWLVLTLGKERKALPVCGAILVGLAIPIAWQVVVFRGSEEFRVKALTVTQAPAFHNIFVSMIFLLIPAVLGAAVLFRQRTKPTRNDLLLIGIWGALTLFSIYLPVSFARKMLEGAQLPIALLAAAAYSAAAGAIASRPARYAVAGFVGLLMFLAPLHFVTYCLERARENNSKFWFALMPPHYLQKSEWEALRYLDKHGDKNFAVLSLPYVGVYGPRETGMTFYLSHWAETLHFEKKVGIVSQFYAERFSPNEGKSWLRANKIKYVIESAYERGISQGSHYAEAYGLKPIWQDGQDELGTIIYEVSAPPSAAGTQGADQRNSVVADADAVPEN